MDDFFEDFEIVVITVLDIEEAFKNTIPFSLHYVAIIEEWVVYYATG